MIKVSFWSKLTIPVAVKITRLTDWHFIKDPLVRSFRTLDLNIEDIDEDSLLNPTAAAVQAIQREAAHLKGPGLEKCDCAGAFETASRPTGRVARR